MSEEIKDAREVSPSLEDSLRKRETPGFGPGYVNLAIPDRGHMGSCIAKEFANDDEFNAFCKEHSDWLTIYLGVRGDRVFAVFQVLKSELDIEEMKLVAAFTEEKMAEYRKKREELKAAEEQARREKEEADNECARIGRFCAEAHGTFIRDLPGLSKIKSIRKNIADDIIKLVQTHLQSWDPPAGPSHDEAVVVVMQQLNKLLAKYVKEGLK